MATNVYHLLEGLADYIQSTGPFGDPEGSRADLDQFVALAPSQAPNDLLLTDDALNTRVLVGRKGSGKTMYLRKLQDLAVHDESLIADSIEDVTQLPSTAHVSEVWDWLIKTKPGVATQLVTSVGDWFAEDILTEMWMLIWQRAITTSLATRALHHAALSKHVDRAGRSRILAATRDLPIALSPRDAVRSPFTFVKEFINFTSGRFGENAVEAGKGLRSLLDDSVWDDLAWTLGVSLQEAPPMFMYVDAIDEEFAHKPTRWLRCQKGLFYATMRLLRADTPLSGRLHLVISVRDVVLSSVYKSEHATRYRSSPHIRSLSWDGLSIRAFLRQKIQALPPEVWLPAKRNPRDLAEWVGLEEVHTKTGEIESVEDFALRHTQVLPRDVVLLGNSLAEKVKEVKASGRARLSESEFREVVEQVGTACGLTHIVTAANQAVAEGDDRIKPLDFERRQESRDEYAETRGDKLLRIIREAGTLRCGSDFVALLRRRGNEDFGCEDLPSILWQVGLLGYVQGDSDIFHRSDFQSQFTLPSDREQYVFHPTMCECAGLKATGRLVDVI